MRLDLRTLTKPGRPFAAILGDVSRPAENPEPKENAGKAQALVLENEVLPILKKQAGLLEIQPFPPEKMKEKKVVTISFLTTKSDAEPL